MSNPAVQLSSPSPEQDLRHISSSGALSPSSLRTDPKAANRASRIGSLSPASMPSSPTSIHSSSSAIFERDIESIAPAPATSSHAPNPHRTARSKATEQIEYAVPSVLDSAAAVLASPDDSIAVVAPAVPSPELAATSRSGLGSPSSRMSSRSASPSAVARPAKLPSPARSETAPLPPLRQPSLGPMMPGAYFPTPVSELPPAPPESATPTTTSPPASLSPSTSSAVPRPAPPSPRAVNNRLSFISYSDLLSSAPAASVPLTSLTSAATVQDPPPHLPAVLGVPQQAASAASGSIRESARSSWYLNDRDVREGRDGLFVDEAGGEWEREGLGQGLEERLDALLGMNQVGTPHVGQVVAPAAGKVQ
ncbi:unnamed protein product [Peniophora sp. CBMAI 1063]|nr:unnamed protein product [Peniophora sp. CBMAI 1063]